MVDILGLIDLQTISMVSAAIGILIGIFNWIRKSSTAEKQRQTEIETRQARLFMDIYAAFTDPVLTDMYADMLYYWEWKDYEDYKKKYVEPKGIQQIIVQRYFNGIGVLVLRGLIDVTLVNDLMGEAITRTWEKFKPMIERRRTDLNWPQLWLPTELLCDKMKPLKTTYEE